MNLKDSKVFNDPVHGHIELPALCVAVIDTPQFQRLRSLKQLGACYFVFPGAAHNRFEHSLGVCYLAGELVEQLRSRQPDLNITDVDVLCVKIAGLCHDLGHGPFSHMFDSRFLPAVRPDHSWTHEDASVKMFEHLVEENELRPKFKECGLNDLDLEFIKEQIAGPIKKTTRSSDSPYRGRDASKSFLYEIVANKRNSVDVDKWDYFARDCYQLGIRSNFDHTRFMKFARVLKVDGELQICSRDKEVGSLYDMFHTRAVLHRRAYQHKTTVIIEHMINEALTLANDHIHFIGKDGKRLRMSEAIDDMVAYTQLDDSVYLRVLHSSEPELARSREILLDIQCRRLYRIIGQTKRVAPKDGSGQTSAEASVNWADVISREMAQQSVQLTPSRLNVRLEPSDIIVLIANFDYGMKDRNPIDNVRFYSKSEPSIAVQVRKNQVSEMLPDTFSEKTIRVYSRRRDATSVETAKTVFPIVCAKLKLQPPKTGEPGAAELTPVKEPQSGATNGDLDPTPAKRACHNLSSAMDIGTNK